MKIQAIHETTSNERALAAISHGSVIVVGWGIAVPLVIWFTQRKTSAFVTFHALQALAYQLFQIACGTIWSLIVPFLGVPIMILAIAISSREAGELSPLFPFLMNLGIGGSMLCGLGLYVVLGLLGAILILARRDFHYPLVGRWLRRYLSDESS